MDTWEILYTQDVWELHLPQPTSTVSSHTVTPEASSLKPPPHSNPVASRRVLTTQDPSGQPKVTSGHQNTAENATRHVKTDATLPTDVLVETSTLGPFRPRPTVGDNGEWFKHHPPDVPLVPQPSARARAPGVVGTTLLGGDNHLPATFGPTRTPTVLPAPSKRLDVVTTTSKLVRNVENDEGKHLEGVLKGRNGQEVEKTRNAFENAGTWLAYHFPIYHTPAPHTMVQESTFVPSNVSKLTHVSSNVTFSTENVYDRAYSPPLSPHTTQSRVPRRQTPVPPFVVQESMHDASAVSKPTRVASTVAFSMENVNGRAVGPPKPSSTTYRRSSPLQAPAPHVMAQDSMPNVPNVAFPTETIRYRASSPPEPSSTTYSRVTTLQTSTPPQLVKESTWNASTVSVSTETVCNRAVSPSFTPLTTYCRVSLPQTPAPSCSVQESTRYVSTVSVPTEIVCVRASSPQLTPTTTQCCVPDLHALAPPRLVQEPMREASTVSVSTENEYSRAYSPPMPPSTTPCRSMASQAPVPPLLVQEPRRDRVPVQEPTCVASNVVFSTGTTGSASSFTFDESAHVFDAVWKKFDIVKPSRKEKISASTRRSVKRTLNTYGYDGVTNADYNKMLSTRALEVATTYMAKVESRGSKASTTSTITHSDIIEENTLCSLSPPPTWATSLPKIDKKVSSQSKPSRPASDMTDVSVTKGEGVAAKTSFSSFSSFDHNLVQQPSKPKPQFRFQSVSSCATVSVVHEDPPRFVESCYMIHSPSEDSEEEPESASHADTQFDDGQDPYVGVDLAIQVPLDTIEDDRALALVRVVPPDADISDIPSHWDIYHIGLAESPPYGDEEEDGSYHDPYDHEDNPGSGYGSPGGYQEEIEDEPDGGLEHGSYHDPYDHEDNPGSGYGSPGGYQEEIEDEPDEGSEYYEGHHSDYDDQEDIYDEPGEGSEYSEGPDEGNSDSPSYTDDE